MSNMIQKWKNDKTPLFVVVAELKQMLTDKRWTEHFLCSETGDIQSYTSSLKYMFETVHLSRCGYASSIFSEDLALQLIKDALNENIEHIAKWLILEESTSMNIMIIADNEIGTIVYKDQSIDETVQYALMCLRKCDIPSRNTSGFYVEFIFPIANI